MTNETRMTQALSPQAASGYPALLKDIKARVRAAQLKAGLAVNRELVLLYWNIGREILARQKQEGWGAKVIDRLSRDLSREFPEMSGLSPPYYRRGKALTNFKRTLPAPQSDLAQQVLKDPYTFDFLALGPPADALKEAKVSPFAA